MNATWGRIYTPSFAGEVQAIAPRDAKERLPQYADSRDLKGILCSLK